MRESKNCGKQTNKRWHAPTTGTHRRPELTDGTHRRRWQPASLSDTTLVEADLGVFSSGRGNSGLGGKKTVNRDKE